MSFRKFFLGIFFSSAISIHAEAMWDPERAELSLEGLSSNTARLDRPSSQNQQDHEILGNTQGGAVVVAPLQTTVSAPLAAPPMPVPAQINPRNPGLTIDHDIFVPLTTRAVTVAGLPMPYPTNLDEVPHVRFFNRCEITTGDNCKHVIAQEKHNLDSQSHPGFMGIRFTATVYTGPQTLHGFTAALRHLAGPHHEVHHLVLSGLRTPNLNEVLFLGDTRTGYRERFTGVRVLELQNLAWTVQEGPTPRALSMNDTNLGLFFAGLDQLVIHFSLWRVNPNVFPPAASSGQPYPQQDTSIRFIAMFADVMRQLDAAGRHANLRQIHFILPGDASSEGLNGDLVRELLRLTRRPVFDCLESLLITRGLRHGGTPNVILNINKDSGGSEEDER